MRFHKVWAALCCSLVVLFATSALPQSLTWLGTLGGAQSTATDVSADGQVVVGWAKLVSGYLRAFRWTAADGMQDLGTLPVYNSASGAHAVCADGTTIVGWSEHPSGVRHAFRWRREEGMRDLGTLGGSWSEAYGVSADGNVVVGDAATPATGGVGHAFRWTPGGGIQDMGTLGGEWSGARQVCADGSIVVGWAYTPDGEYHACRWDTAGTPLDLDTLGGVASVALACSLDGSVVVGWSYNEAALFRAFYWTDTEDIRHLGILPQSYYAWAYDVSGDGRIAVGETSLLNAGHRALRWRVGMSVEDLNVTYASLLSDGSLLQGAYAISENGRFIVGYGIHATTRRTEAFVLDTEARTFRISGNINLRDYVGDITQVPVQVELRQDGSLVRADTVYTDANANYVLSDVSAGSYQLAFKASHWLRVAVPVILVDADVGGVNVALTNGDVDGDNEVTLFDFGQMVAAFGAMPGDSHWNPEADVDGDGEVTLFDFGILVRSFGAVGD